MFLAMSQGFRIRKIQQLDTWMRVFRGNRFVAQVQAEPIASRFAYNPSEHQRSRKEIHIAKLGSVTRIPEDTRSRTAFHVLMLGVDGKCWSAPSDDPWHGQTR